MENKLLIRTEMFGYSKSDTENYILKLQTEFDRKLEDAENHFKVDSERFENSYILMEEAKQKLSDENRALEEKIRQITEEYEKKIADLKSENENLSEAMEVLLSSPGFSKSEKTETPEAVHESEEMKALPPAEFSRLYSAIQLSDESLFEDSLRMDSVRVPDEMRAEEAERIRTSLNELSESIRSFTQDTLDSISKIKDSV